MTITITTQKHTYIIDDPEELEISVEGGEAVCFDASNEDGVQVFRLNDK